MAKTRIYLTPDFVVITSSDGLQQTFIKIDEESEAYLAVKVETNNFTENMNFPKTEVELLQDELVLVNSQVDLLTLELGDSLLNGGI